MVKLLLLLIILILVNAFLAASEVSVVSLNKNRLRELAEDGDRKAQRLLKFAEEPNIFFIYDSGRDYTGRISGQCSCSGRICRQIDGMGV